MRKRRKEKEQERIEKKGRQTKKRNEIQSLEGTKRQIEEDIVNDKLRGINWEDSSRERNSQSEFVANVLRRSTRRWRDGRREDRASSSRLVDAIRMVPEQAGALFS